VTRSSKREEELARLYRESERRRRHAEALAEAARLLATADSGGDPIPGILEAASVVIPATVTALVLPSSGNDELENVVVSRGHEQRIGLRIPIERGVTGRAFRTRATQIVDDVRTDPDFVNLLAESWEPRSELAVPVLLRGETLGVLNLESADPAAFGPDEATVMEAFADHVAIVFERERQLSELRRLTLSDGLTGLPNRRRFREILAQAIEGTAVPGGSFSVIYVDLDRFREVMDAFGQEGGDEILREVGARIEKALPSGDVVARFGADRFAVLTRSARDYVGATLAGERILDALGGPFCAGGQTAYLEASIGAALYPDQAQTADALIRAAEVAMYMAKEAGGGFALYAADADPRSERRIELMSELREAIPRGELTLAYQPKIDARSERLIGVEALVRWRHPTRGTLPPAEFVPLAERTGLIKPLTLWVIGEALRQCGRWARDGHDVPVAVNISTRSLRDTVLFDAVDRLLRSSGVPACRLMLEITEGTVMNDPERTISLLQRFHDRGIQISIDDFGTGHSSLAYLDRIPADEVKIDRAFIHDVATNESHAGIVRAVTELSHSFGLRVVAEGVEDRLCWERAALLGCDAVQGFAAGRPVAGADITVQ
jgi:diguanylate cyclase (GGDEF)-like protein